jgi:hypothetical protein
MDCITVMTGLAWTFAYKLQFQFAKKYQKTSTRNSQKKTPKKNPQKKTQENGHWDVADACKQIYQRWQKHGRIGRPVTSMLVSEIQIE